MRGKVVLVTGGNAGIGKATAAELVRRGASVVLSARSAKKAEQAIGELGGGEALLLDLASFDSIRAAAVEFRRRFERLDVLINNAGLTLDQRQTTREGFEMTLGVNHVGHFLLTRLLLPALQKAAPSRVVNVASAAHRMALGGLDFNDLQSEKNYRGLLVYARSKLANLLFTRELARRVAALRVTANAVHPGTVSSRFALDGDTGGYLKWFYRIAAPVLASPERGAETSVFCAADPSLVEVTGQYFVRSRPAKPSRAGRDDHAAKQLWEISERWLEQGHP